MDVPTRAFVDLHCHTSASFDSLAHPAAVARAAAARGLTHLAITDHGTIDGALRARDAAPSTLHVLVGEEIRTTAGDLIAVFLERAIPAGLSPSDAIAAVREQGGLVGIPHPFDRRRGSLLARAADGEVAGLVDWVEAYNARVFGSTGNERAASFAHEHGLPGIAASDAHSTLEVAVAYTILAGDASTPDGLRAALPGAELVVGRASYVVRLFTPFAKAVHALERRRERARAR
ncbi:MAG TPA: PHP domain-containing protein [Candidatus Limnocylindrales bacterium]|nr:PHP domain-containing protein [Candidatus Limnocylindrales bacterium]